MKKIYILDNNLEYSDHEIVFAEVDTTEWPNFEQLAMACGWVILGAANSIDWKRNAQPTAFHPELPFINTAKLLATYAPSPSGRCVSLLPGTLANIARPSEAKALHEQWSIIHSIHRTTGEGYEDLTKGLSELRLISLGKEPA